MHLLCCHHNEGLFFVHPFVRAKCHELMVNLVILMLPTFSSYIAVLS